MRPIVKPALTQPAASERAMGRVAAALSREERRRLVRFAAVGMAGFIVDAGVLSALVQMTDLGPFAARGPSFLAAVTVTWALNRRLSFAGLGRFAPGAEYRRYFLVQTAGALANLGVYGAAIALLPRLGQVPIVPLAFGAAVSLLLNFGLSRWLVFPGASR